MPLSDADLWQKIADWPLPCRAEWDALAEPPRNCTRFEHNLRLKGDWTDESALRLTEEYRRFLYLKALAGGPLTPPEEVDQVWHLHLEMGEDFSEGLCRAIGIPLTHEPGLARQAALASYEWGFGAYIREFGAAPPGDIWPRPDVLRRERYIKPFAFLGFAIFLIGVAVMFIGGAVYFFLAAVLAAAAFVVMVLGGDPEPFQRLIELGSDGNAEGSFAFGLWFGVTALGFGLGLAAGAFLPETPAKIARCG